MGKEVSSGVGSGGRERLLPMSRAVEEADAVLLVIPGVKCIFSKNYLHVADLCRW